MQIFFLQIAKGIVKCFIVECKKTQKKSHKICQRIILGNSEKLDNTNKIY